jgi:hypothetical protein
MDTEREIRNSIFALVAFLCLFGVHPAYAQTVTVFPDNLTVTDATLLQGNVNTLNETLNNVTVQESAGTPGACIFMNGSYEPDNVVTWDFTLVADYPSGFCNAGHIVDVYWRNVTLNDDQFLAQLVCGAGPTNFTLTGIPDADFRNAGDNMSVWINHGSAGNINHIINVTYLEFIGHLPAVTTSPIVIEFPLNDADLCPDDNCAINIFAANRSLDFDYVNVTLEGVELQICNTTLPICLDIVHADVEAAVLGRHFVYVNTSLGNDTVWINFVNGTTYFEFPFALEVTEIDGSDKMLVSIYIALMLGAFGLLVASTILTNMRVAERFMLNSISMVLFGGLGMWGQDLSTFTGGVEATFQITELAWLNASMFLLTILYGVYLIFFVSEEIAEIPEEGVGLGGLK